MTFPSTRGNPRLGQSSAALTSLGAVGGPRGIGAGALRILVEFLSTYNKGAADQLQADLSKIDRGQAIADAAQTKRLQRLSVVRRQLSQADALVQGRLNTQQRTQLKQVEALSILTTKDGQARAAQSRTLLNATLTSIGLSKNEIALINNRLQLREKETKISKQQEEAEGRTADRLKQRTVVEKQLAVVQAGRASLGARLGGLAIGAVGGIVGGALIGVGFQLAQDALDAIGEKLKDIVDPGRHARDAILAVGEAIDKLADARKLSFFDAAVQYLKELGLEADSSTVSLLAQAAAEKKVADSIEALNQIAVIQAHADAQSAENRAKLRDALIAEAKATGKNVQEQAKYVDIMGPTSFSRIVTSRKILIDGIDVETLVTQKLGDITRQVTNDQYALANAERVAAGNAYIAAIAQRNLAAALQSAFEAQLTGLGTGESSRAKRLQARIEALQGGVGSSVGPQLRNLAQERELILLRQRLRLLGANINLERYSGKFLLEAINAKIAALQKQGDEQDRLNRLLDLQYQAGQQIRRQEGESIQAFLERRAQEQRHQLEERAKLERDAAIAALESRRDQVQDEVDLAELAEQKKQLLRQAGTSNLIKELQKQLEAQRAADQKALERKRKALQEQQKTVEYYSNLTNIGQIRAAIYAAKTVDQIAKLSGESRGLQAARNFLQALLSSGVLTPAQAASVRESLQAINQALAELTRKSTLLYLSAMHNPYAGKIANMPGFQHGGVFPITNAQNPFAQNARAGESGTELGVVLSNRVVQALRTYGVPAGGAQFGDFNFYGGGWDDRYAMRYDLKETIKEVLREELHA